MEDKFIQGMEIQISKKEVEMRGIKIFLLVLVLLVGWPAYATQIVGVEVDSTNALQFKLLMDSAPSHEEENQITEYFLTGITVPEKDLWVNLSPFEKEKVIPDVIQGFACALGTLIGSYDELMRRKAGKE